MFKLFHIVIVLLCILGINNAQETFKIGMVNDQFLKYAQQDNQIYNGTMWWANWVNKQGGLMYLIFYLKKEKKCLKNKGIIIVLNW
jgi:hypothetical protein